MAVVGSLVIGRQMKTRLPVSGSYSAPANFQTAMPAGATYTRSTTATGQSVSGVLTLFAIDAPQRTNRGLALEPARTNLLVNSLLAGGGTTPTSWTLAGATGTSTPVASTVYPAGAAYTMAGTAQRSFHQQGVTLDVGVSTFSFNVEAVSGGLNAGQCGAIFAAGATADPWTYPVCPANPSGGTSGVLTTGRLDIQINVTVAGTCTARCGMGVGANATGSITYSTPQVEFGTFSTSFIPTAGATASRTLPVFTEVVPAGQKRVLLTYFDATTTTVVGLLPGGTFDEATAVIGAGKGRSGSSELVSRMWQS